MITIIIMITPAAGTTVVKHVAVSIISFWIKSIHMEDSIDDYIISWD